MAWMHTPVGAGAEEARVERGDGAAAARSSGSGGTDDAAGRGGDGHTGISLRGSGWLGSA